MAPPLIRFAARRVLFGALAVWFAATLAFVLVHAAPGDPVAALGGEHGAAGLHEETAQRLGLNEPLLPRYLHWLARLAQGDLGHSYRWQAPVTTLIGERVGVTLALMLPALLLATVAGLGLGLVAADRRRGAPWVAGALAGLHAVPSFVVAQGLVLVLALGLGWFPVQGLVDARTEAGGVAGALVMARHLVLPVLTLALLQTAFVALVTRARVAEELNQAYISTALAKGLTPEAVKRRHALPNAALPLLTLIGWRLGAVIGGSVVIETVFALPGLGRLAVTSALARDHPVLIGIVVVTCAVMVGINVCIDVLAARADPRLRAVAR